MSLIKYDNIKIHESQDPLIVLDDSNFILEPIYYNLGLSNDPKIYIRKRVAKKLNKVQGNLKKYKIKIWDGLRLRLVQNNIYQANYDTMKIKFPEWDKEQLRIYLETYVTSANVSSRIPSHSTGGSVDLTLVYIPTGEELDMGTNFDDFSCKSAALFYEINNVDKKIRDNRRILRESMLEEGFTYDDDEWWHFDYGNQIWAYKRDKSYAFYGEITKTNYA